MAFKKHKEKFGDTSSGFLPIAIGGEVFALDYDADIKFKDILDSITKGIPIYTQ